MGWTVKKHRGLKISYNFDNFRGYKKAFENYFGKEKGVYRAAAFVQRKAFNRVKDVYMATKSSYPYTKSGTERNYLGKQGRLEQELFNRANLKPTPLSGRFSYQIEVINNIGTLIENIPYLSWQEEGVRSNIDNQPFIKVAYRNPKTKQIEGYKYYSVSKADALTMPKNKIHVIKVRHPNLKARHFIRAGNLYLKYEAENDFRQHITKGLKRRFS